MLTHRALLIAPLAAAALAVAGCGGHGQTGGSSRSAAHPVAATPAPSLDARLAALRRDLRTRVSHHTVPAMAVGVLLPDGTTRVFSAGDAGGGHRPTAESGFEIGSITKTLTATLLARMVAEGRVRLDEPLARLLPGWHVPTFHGRPIRVIDVATQTSGLPRDPSPVPGAPSANPWSGLTPSILGTDLAHTRLTSAPGTTYGYSNLAFGLLGEGLSARARRPFAELLRARVLRPLGMTHTAVEAPPGVPVAVGHDALGRATPPARMGAMAPAGAVRSTLVDMLRYAALALHPAADPLGAALATTQVPRRPAGPDMRVGLAWHVAHVGGRDIVWHNGGTFGFHSFIGLDTSRDTAVVMWVNGAGAPDDVAMHFLEPGIPVRPVVSVPAQVLGRYTGAYRLRGAPVRIVRAPAGLAALIPGQEPLQLMPMSPTRFAVEQLGAGLEFHSDASGRVTGFAVGLPSGPEDGVRCAASGC